MTDPAAAAPAIVGQAPLRVRLVPALIIGLTVLGGLLLVGLHQARWGWAALILAAALAAVQTGPLRRDLLLALAAFGLVGLAPVSTNLTLSHIATMSIMLITATVAPYLIARYVFHERLITYRFRHGRPWTRREKLYLIWWVALGYFIFPVYFATTGSYHNWTVGTGPNLLGRLFFGTNTLGIWDELFFINTMLPIFNRYLPFKWANLATAVLFVSFLYELGFHGWGPIALFAFALSQGYIYMRTHSLLYIITIHLTVDFFLYLALIHAAHPAWPSVFLY